MKTWEVPIAETPEMPLEKTPGVTPETLGIPEAAALLGMTGGAVSGTAGPEKRKKRHLV